MTLQTTGHNTADAAFELQSFLPYLVRVFYVDVSSKVTSTYETQFDMSPAEWRTMAILRPGRSLSATQIVEKSSMDKVIVSRAVSKLTARGWIKIETNNQDRRSKLLHLSQSGVKVYRTIVPKIQSAEKELLHGLSEDQIETLIVLMAKIRQNCLP